MKKLFTMLCFSIFSLSSLQALELQRVILSTNNNPDYIQFWPVVAPIWEEMGLRPTLILVGNENCVVDTEIGDVIRFPPLAGINEALQAQVLRLFFPIFFPNEGCLIADIDMLPISRSYFFEGALNVPSTAFLVYRDCAYGCGAARFSMCYVAAEGHVFGSIFGISNFEDIQNLLRKWASVGYGWNTDELLLYRSVINWEQMGNEVVRLGHGVGARLDRSDWKRDFKLADVKNSIDCHCPRPYSAYKDSIDKVVELIHELNRNS